MAWRKGTWIFPVLLAIALLAPTILGSTNPWVAEEPHRCDLGIQLHPAEECRELWVNRYRGPTGGQDIAFDAAVSHDDETVYVAGGSFEGAGHQYAIVAIDADSGETKWATRSGETTVGAHVARSIEVAPDDLMVYITGESRVETTVARTIALDAGTGEIVWEASYEGPTGTSAGRSLTATAEGDHLVVLAASEGEKRGTDVVLLGYDASTGEQRWVDRRQGPYSADGVWVQNNLVLAPEEDVVYAASARQFAEEDGGWRTALLAIAVDPATGEDVWEATYDHPGGGGDFGQVIDADPLGHFVYVSGFSVDDETGRNFITVAFDANTGATEWVRRYSGDIGAEHYVNAVLANPDGEHVHVAGMSAHQLKNGIPWWEYATVTYNASTGEQVWDAHYLADIEENDVLWDAALAPDG